MCGCGALQRPFIQFQNCGNCLYADFAHSDVLCSETGYSIHIHLYRVIRGVYVTILSPNSSADLAPAFVDSFQWSHLQESRVDRQNTYLAWTIYGNSIIE